MSRIRIAGSCSILAGMLGCFLPSSETWGLSKVYLVDGQTRVGFVNVRDGRITVRGETRLFQHPEERIHRIAHEEGQSTLVGRDNVLLKDSPGRTGKNTIAVPKGCEVKILGHEGVWTHVEVYGDQSRAEGYIHADNLSDSVMFNPVDPSVRWRPPPQRIFPEPRASSDWDPNRETWTPSTVTNETDFGAFRFGSPGALTTEEALSTGSEENGDEGKDAAADEDLSREVDAEGEE